MSKPKVLLSRRWPKAVEEKATRLFDATLNVDDRPMTGDQLRDAMGAYDALMPTVTDRVDASVINADPRRVKIIGNFGVGFNNIDIEAAKSAGIVVTNTPEVLTDCTADIALLLILGVARRGGEGERHLRGGDWIGWRPTHMMGTKVSGKTLALIGFGRIARATAHRAHHGFGMNIVYYDPYYRTDGEEKSLAARRVDSLDAVLAEGDFVSIHCPATPETRHLINGDTLARMKPGAYLINSARGDIVDEDALVTALAKGTIKGAGLDVYAGEPSIHPGLLQAENAFLLPHLGSASLETREAMGMRVVTNVEAFFAGQAPPDRVA